eukprot:jgi/Chlat1/6974/Chrsp52S06622
MAFGSSTPRFQETRGSTPGPGAYSVDDHRVNDQMSSFFLSKEERFRLQQQQAAAEALGPAMEPSYSKRPPIKGVRPRSGRSLRELSRNSSLSTSSTSLNGRDVEDARLVPASEQETATNMAVPSSSRPFNGAANQEVQAAPSEFSAQSDRHVIDAWAEREQRLLAEVELLQANIEAAHGARSRLEGELEHQRHEYSVLRQAAQSTAHALSQLHEEIKTNGERTAHLQKHAAMQALALSEAATDIKAKAAECSRLMEMAQAMEAKLMREVAAREDAEARLASASEQMRAKHEELANLQESAMSQAAREVQVRTQECAQLSDAVQATEARLQQELSTRKDAEAQLAVVDAQNRKREQEISELQTTMAAQEIQLAKVLQELSQLVHEREALAQEHSELKEVHATGQAVLEERDMQIKGLTAAIDEKQRLHEHTAELTRAHQAAIQELQHEITDKAISLTQHIRDANSTIAELKAANAQLNLQVTAKDTRTEELSKELAVTRKKLSMATIELSQRMAETRGTEQELQAALASSRSDYSSVSHNLHLMEQALAMSNAKVEVLEQQAIEHDKAMTLLRSDAHHYEALLMESQAQNKASQAKLSNLHDQLESTQSMVAELRQALMMRDKQTAKLQHHNHDLELQLEKMNTELTSCQTDLSDLQLAYLALQRQQETAILSHYEQLNQQNQNHVDEVEKFRAEASMLTHRLTLEEQANATLLAESKAKLGELGEHIMELQDRCLELEKAVSVKEEQLQAHVANDEAVQAQLEQSKQDMAAISAELSLREEQLQAHVVNDEAVQAQLEQCKQDMATISAQLALKEEQLQAHVTNNEAAQAQLKQNRNDMAIISAQLHQAEATHATASRAWEVKESELESKFEQQQQTILEAQTEIAECTARLAEVESQLADSMEAAFAIQMEAAQYQATISSLKGKLQESNQDLTVLQQQLAQRNEQMSDYQSRQQELMQSLESKEAHAADLQRQLAASSTAMQVCYKELKAKDARVAELNAECTSFQAELGDIQAEHLALQRQMEATVLKYDAQVQQLKAQHAAEVEKISAQIRSMQIKLEATKSESQVARQQASSLQDKLNNVEKAAELHQNQLSKVEKAAELHQNQLQAYKAGNHLLETQLRQKTQDLQGLQAQLKDSEETHVAAINMLESKVEAKDLEINKLREEMAARVEAEATQQAQQQVDAQLAEIKAKSEESTLMLELELQRLRTDNQSLKEHVTQLEANLQEMVDMHASLVDHNNHKQKIHHHMKVKDQLQTARKELLTLEEEKVLLEQVVRYLVYRQLPSHLQKPWHRLKQVNIADKENTAGELAYDVIEQRVLAKIEALCGTKRVIPLLSKSVESAELQLLLNQARPTIQALAITKSGSYSVAAQE